MNDQLSRLNKSLPANVTPMRPLARVNPDMSMQFPRMFERPSAHLTRIGSLLGVNASVDAQILLDGKRLVAVFACEWLFARVDAVVSGQPCGNAEGLVALVALVHAGGRGVVHSAVLSGLDVLVHAEVDVEGQEVEENVSAKATFEFGLLV